MQAGMRRLWGARHVDRSGLGLERIRRSSWQTGHERARALEAAGLAHVGEAGCGWLRLAMTHLASPLLRQMQRLLLRVVLAQPLRLLSGNSRGTGQLPGGRGQGQRHGVHGAGRLPGDAGCRLSQAQFAQACESARPGCCGAERPKSVHPQSAPQQWNSGHEQISGDETSRSEWACPPPSRRPTARPAHLPARPARPTARLNTSTKPAGDSTSGVQTTVHQTICLTNRPSSKQAAGSNCTRRSNRKQTQTTRRRCCPSICPCDRLTNNRPTARPPAPPTGPTDTDLATV